MTSAARAELQREALYRAEQGQALTNYPAIFAGFMEKGIPEQDIVPRVNVFTFNAWKAKGRRVRKGEHGVTVWTYITVEQRAGEPETDDGQGPPVRAFRRPKSTTVFHISQTEPEATR